MKERWNVRGWLGLVLLLVATQGCGRAADQPVPVSRGPRPDHDLFSDTNIVRISISIAPGDLKAFRKYSWHGGQSKERPEVKATVTEGTWVYTNVALQLKGAAGSFRPVDDRPALTLNFDKFANGQRFHGLQKISLNNSVQDASYLDEKICRELFAAAGVPVPRSDYAVVTLNGRQLGLYVLVEGFNKQFLKRYYKQPGGNLYDGGFCRDIDGPLQLNSGDKKDDQSDRERLVQVAYKARQDGRLEELAKVLDVERFVLMIAMEVIQCHWDGYALNRNNYRLYHDVGSGRMVFMPHGLDQMFGTGERSDVYAPVVPRMNGLVANAVMSTREGRELYLRRVGELRTNVLKVDAVTNRLRELEQRLRPVLAEAGQGIASWHRSEVNRLCQNIAARAASIDEQLAAPNEDLVFDDEGNARLSGWRPRIGGPGGSGVFRTASTPDGKEALQIIASSENPAASWRARVFLPQGRYRFEGKASTRGASRSGDSGATLRISGAQNAQLLKGDSDWTLLSFTFEVREPNQEVELVCELKGNKGQAWFDRKSLRLRRH